MSMQRTLLRTAIIAALKDRTIAEGRVFDSRISPVQMDAAQDYLPLIAVYTDSDKRALLDTGAPAGAFRRTVDVTIEYSIGAWRQVMNETAEPTLVFGLLQTDAELECVLDLFELQIWRAFYRLSPEGDNLQGLVKFVHGWDSIPGRDDSGDNKISARQLTITCEIADDCRRTVAPKVPLDRWAPHLSKILGDIAATPAFASMGAMMAELTGSKKPPPLGVPLKIIEFAVDEISPAVDPALLPPGRTLGPDGRVEARFNTKLQGAS